MPSKFEFIYTGTLDNATIPKLLKALEKATQEWDFDSGFIATAAAGSIKHNLGVCPQTALVFTSAKRGGEPYRQILATAVTRETISYTGADAFVRVQVQS